ncbi:hypothetical protein RIF29_26659 [Crotalaria pallida]|uniref:Uncharacterized protein n=1 Tax=Crotalaria pallida TaxID=3830 RepID=A0AAN9ENX5_CROPI
MSSIEDYNLSVEAPLLQGERSKQYTGDGSVDLKGKPILKKNTGNWRACLFVLGIESCDGLASFSLTANLVNYLTTKLHEGNVVAARNISIWQGTRFLTPLIGAVVADAYLGRYWTLVVFSVVFSIGLSIITLSASLPALKPPECLYSVCPAATPAQYFVFYLGLYIVALGMGGVKTCVVAFGADQFDDTDTVETIKRGSFFNWLYFAMYVGAIVSCSLIVWIQDNVGWGLGFGIPTLFMGLSAGSFILGTPLYRIQKPRGSAITKMCQVVVASVRKQDLIVPNDTSLLYETPVQRSAVIGSHKLEHSDDLRYFDRAAVMSDAESKTSDYSNPWRLCTVTQVEELKILIRMFPIWFAVIFYTIVYAQMTTFFVEQGTLMDTSIGSINIPPASLVTFNVLSAIFWVPVYDRVIVPIARKLTGKEKGISELQRIGIGLFISSLCMLAAAIVEIARLQLARKHDLTDKPVAVPLSVFWQLPQYILLGASDILTAVGIMEFFYDQSTYAMRTLCTALYLLNFSLGNYLSSLILTIAHRPASPWVRPREPALAPLLPLGPSHALPHLEPDLN